MIKIWSELPGGRIKEQVADFLTLAWLLFWGGMVGPGKERGKTQLVLPPEGTVCEQDHVPFTTP